MERSKTFYRAALAPLGCDVRMEFGPMVGIGPRGKPAFWLRQGEAATHPMHIAFSAADRRSVEAFHAAALAAGASDNGGPGLRPDYHPNYYAAFVLDPDGNNIEAVCHAPPGGARKAAPRKKARPAPRRASARAGARKARARKRG
jgi:catechol 2,3-dioxygenase-like lactoylglutathione lyase family enzyme